MSERLLFFVLLLSACEGEKAADLDRNLEESEDEREREQEKGGMELVNGPDRRGGGGGQDAPPSQLPCYLVVFVRKQTVYLDRKSDRISSWILMSCLCLC